MRDPERIARIINKLHQVWERHPDFRLCQLLDNTVRSHSDTFSKDFFYVEDGDLEKRLDAELLQEEGSNLSVPEKPLSKDNPLSLQERVNNLFS